MHSILGSGRFPGIGNSNPLQYSCLENSMDRGVWWVTVHGVAKSQIGHESISHITLLFLSIYLKLLCVSCSVVSTSFQPHGLWPTRLLCPWNFPDKNTGVGCHSLLQGIFPTQGSNLYLLCLLHGQVGSLPLAPAGKPVCNPTTLQEIHSPEDLPK